MAIESIKTLLKNGNEKEAESVFFKTLFAFSVYAKTSEEEILAEGFLKMFNYVRSVHFSDEFPTACVDLRSGDITIGKKFFIDNVESMEDVFFIVFHERNHVLLKNIYENDMSREIDVPFSIVNIAEDAFINSKVAAIVETALPEKYYNKEEPVDSDEAMDGDEDTKILYRCLSSNSFGLKDYIKKKLGFGCDSERTVGKAMKLLDSGSVSDLFYLDDLELLSTFLVVSHRSMYQDNKSNVLFRNRPDLTGEERDFYNAGHGHGTVGYSQWMTAFYKWFKMLPDKLADEISGSTKVITINIPSDMYDAVKNSIGKQYSEDSGNNTAPGSGKAGNLPKDIIEKMNDLFDALKHEEKKNEKSKPGHGCGDGNEGYVKKFPKVDINYELFVDELATETSMGEKDDIRKNMKKSPKVGILKANRDICSTVAKDIISANSMNRDIVGTSVVIPASISRKDLFSIAGGYQPVLYQKTIDISKNDFVMYSDVSGSMGSSLHIVGNLIKELSEHISRCFVFSTIIGELDLDELETYRTTGGTNFDIVAKHIIDNRFRNVIVASDGECSMSRENFTRLVENNINLYYIKIGSSSNGYDDAWLKLTKHKVRTISG